MPIEQISIGQMSIEQMSIGQMSIEKMLNKEQLLQEKIWTKRLLYNNCRKNKIVVTVATERKLLEHSCNSGH